MVAFYIFSYSASGLCLAKERFYCPKKGLLINFKNLLNYESIIITVELLCYSFTFDEKNEEWLNKQKH